MRTAGYSDGYPEAVPALELWAIAEQAASTCGARHGPELSRCLDNVLGQYLCPCVRNNSLIWQAMGREFIAHMHCAGSQGCQEEDLMDELHQSTLEIFGVSTVPVGGRDAPDRGRDARPKRLPVHGAASGDQESFSCYICALCGWSYDEYLGLPDRGIPEQTRWQDVPDSFVCPECGVGKQLFQRDS